MSSLSTDILREILVYCTRDNLELLQIVNHQFNSVITNYFPVTPYRVIPEFSVQCSLAGLKFNIRQYVEPNKVDYFSIRDSVTSILPYLKPTTKAETTKIVVYIDCLEYFPCEVIIEHLALMAPFWSSGKLELELNGINKKIQEKEEEFMSLLFKHPRHLLKCKIATFSMYFNSAYGRYDYRMCKDLYECDKVCFTKTCKHKFDIIQFMDDVNETRSMRRSPLNVRICIVGFDTAEFVLMCKKCFHCAKEPNPYLLTLADTYFEEVEELESFQLHNSVTKETLSLEILSLPSNATYNFETDEVVLWDNDDRIEDPLEERRVVTRSNVQSFEHFLVKFQMTKFI
uniref:F-box domain-containing protein n=1 Tax=Ditylenchus dipsaci TaxID=166011 RepID=A0A915D889_9BILA